MKMPRECSACGDPVDVYTDLYLSTWAWREGRLIIVLWCHDCRPPRAYSSPTTV